eukprot:scaffold90121_cov30-Tisochrysis_lutea.AAC.8
MTAAVGYLNEHLQLAARWHIENCVGFDATQNEQLEEKLVDEPHQPRPRIQFRRFEFTELDLNADGNLAVSGLHGGGLQLCGGILERERFCDAESALRHRTVQRGQLFAQLMRLPAPWWSVEARDLTYTIVLVEHPLG